MYKPGMLVVIAATLLVGACDKAKDAKKALDPALQERIKTMKDCFPALYEKADRLFEIANSWRLRTSPIPDPAGLTWQMDANMITVSYAVTPACTIDAMLRFYGPTGQPETVTVVQVSTLSEVVDAVATELRDKHPAAKPFIVASWMLSGSVGSGSGNITGIIGGTTNQNELEELRTTEETPSNGPPPIAAGTVTLTSGCILEFSTSSLKTDTVVDQQYPIGTISLTITGSGQILIATITMDNTVFATITVNDVPGSFSYNLDTGDLQYNP